MFHCRRMPRETYLAASKELLHILNDEMGLRAETTKSFASKPDFGDIDIVAARPDHKFTCDIVAEFRRRINAIFCVSDNNSMDYHFMFYWDGTGTQIDLMFTAPETFDFFLGLSSYSEITTILGMLASEQGLLIDGRGLWVRMYSNTNRKKAQHFANVRLTSDWSQFLNFMGLECSVAEFADPEDMYRWLVSSRFFRPEIFIGKPDASSINRWRARKRPIYTRFLEYLKREFPDAPRYTKHENSSVCQEAIHCFGKTDVCDEARKIFDCCEAASKRFNGNIVSNLTGLTGASLGSHMKELNRMFGDTGDCDTCLEISADIKLFSEIRSKYHLSHSVMAMSDDALQQVLSGVFPT